METVSLMIVKIDHSLAAVEALARQMAERELFSNIRPVLIIIKTEYLQYILFALPNYL